MNAFWRTLVLSVVIVVPSPGLLAQCAEATVTVQGRVENLPAGMEAHVAVVLKTPKGNISKKTAVADGQFRVDVDFNTQKSWSPLWGHRCSNVPKVVDVTLKHADRVLAREELKFGDSFESRDSLTYSLKRELVLDASKMGGTGNRL